MKRIWAVVYRPHPSDPEFVIDSIHVFEETANKRLDHLKNGQKAYIDLQVAPFEKRESESWLKRCARFFGIA